MGCVALGCTGIAARWPAEAGKRLSTGITVGYAACRARVRSQRLASTFMDQVSKRKSHLSEKIANAYPVVLDFVC